jgi:hypothetical protein
MFPSGGEQMAESPDPCPYPSDGPDVETLPRCCETHPDWPTLSQHLVEDFPDVPVDDLVREVRRAREAVERVSLPIEEALAIGELVIRHQLMMRAGHVREVARLDPERHRRASA